MKKRCIVRRQGDERDELEGLVKKSKAAAYKIIHANILLSVDADGPGWSDEKTAQAFRCHRNTVCKVRQRFVEQGLEATLNRKKQRVPSRRPILDAERGSPANRHQFQRTAAGALALDLEAASGQTGGVGRWWNRSPTRRCLER